LFQSHRQKIDFTSKILRRSRKLAKSIFSMRIWIVKKFSIFFSWSCSLKRFLSTRSIWIEIETSTKNAYSVHFFFQQLMWKRLISLFLWLLKWLASWSNRTEFAQIARRTTVEDVCLSISCCVIHSCFSSLEMNLCIRDLFRSLISLLIHIEMMWSELNAIHLNSTWVE
jgi:hypothetical protein